MPDVSLLVGLTYKTNAGSDVEIVSRDRSTGFYCDCNGNKWNSCGEFQPSDGLITSHNLCRGVWHLEVGYTYVTHKGDIVKIVSKREGDFGFLGNNGTYYTKMGVSNKLGDNNIKRTISNVYEIEEKPINKVVKTDTDILYTHLDKTYCVAKKKSSSIVLRSKPIPTEKHGLVKLSKNVEINISTMKDQFGVKYTESLIQEIVSTSLKELIEICNRSNIEAVWKSIKLPS